MHQKLTGKNDWLKLTCNNLVATKLQWLGWGGGGWVEEPFYILRGLGKMMPRQQKNILSESIIYGDDGIHDNSCWQKATSVTDISRMQITLW